MGKISEKIGDIYYQLGRKYTVFKWLDDFQYWFKDTFIHPNNVVKIKTLNKRWHEPDEVMLHAIFQILVDHVNNCNSSPYFKIHVRNDEEIDKEMECYKNYPEETQKEFREAIEEDNRLMQEIWDLYQWWKWRPTRPENIEDVYFDDMPEMKNVDLDKLYEEEDLSMTIRLMKIRTCLWT